jgi:hypothetical protein
MSCSPASAEQVSKTAEPFISRISRRAQRFQSPPHGRAVGSDGIRYTSSNQPAGSGFV